MHKCTARGPPIFTRPYDLKDTKSHQTPWRLVLSHKFRINLCPHYILYTSCCIPHAPPPTPKHTNASLRWSQHRPVLSECQPTHHRLHHNPPSGPSQANRNSSLQSSSRWWTPFDLFFYLYISTVYCIYTSFIPK